MSKANRTCYCCGRKYYYCPSCPDDRRDPRIYVMWDSEECREIFMALTNESTKKLSTLECKNKLIELGVNENTVLKDNIRKHVDRVMSYEEIKTDKIVEEIEENNENVITGIVVETIEEKPEKTVAVESEIVVGNVKKVNKTRTRKSSLKNKENSEVD